MTAKELHKAETIIRLVAQKEGKSEEEVRQAMQEALDAAWTATWRPKNILAQAKWQQLFGARKPSVEEFISTLSAQIQNDA